MIKGIKHGVGIFIGFCISAVFAYTVSGTIKTWTTGDTLTASDLNTTIQSLKTAAESMSQMQQVFNQPSSGTQYTGIFNSSNATEANIQTAMPRSGVLRNIMVAVYSNSCTTAPTLVLRNNGVDTPVTFTGSAATTVLPATAVAGTLTFTTGDRITWKGTCPSGFVNFGITFDF